MNATKVYKAINDSKANTNDLYTLVIGGSVHTKQQSGSGRWTHITERPDTKRLRIALAALNITPIEGNDAPRGGQLGDNISISKNDRRRLAEWRNMELARRIEEAEKAKEKKMQDAQLFRMQVLEVKNYIHEHGLNATTLAKLNSEGKSGKVAGRDRNTAYWVISLRLQVSRQAVRVALNELGMA